MAPHACARRDRGALALRRRPRGGGTGLTDTVPLAVEARGWSWRHGGRLAWAVRDLDLSIAPGERVLLLGPSGAGKSTLARALAGVLDREAGESTGSLTVGGFEPEAARGGVGLVFQNPEAQVILDRVGDDVAFGCENLGVPRDQLWRRVRASLDVVGLSLALDRSTSTLSGGEKQRLALAGALALHPGLLVLDEPTAHLDPASALTVRDAVAASLETAPATLLVIEHRVDPWLDLVDRVVVLGPDGLLADGTPEVLERDADRLAAAGVWMPHRRPPRTPARVPGAALLATLDLLVARAPRTEPALAIRTPDLTLAERVVLAITGRSGSGKSTLGLTLAGLLPSIGGSVEARPALAAGAASDPARWRSRELLTRIGVVLQNPEASFLAPTVRGELEVGPRALGHRGAALAAIVDPLLEALDLASLERANPFTLSGGQQRRLSVAAALATAPRVLVLDEPTFGQDARTWAALVALLAGLAEAGTALVTLTHDRPLVDALADREVALS